jgi:hypothetical protein
MHAGGRFFGYAFDARQRLRVPAFLGFKAFTNGGEERLLFFVVGFLKDG